MLIKIQYSGGSGGGMPLHPPGPQGPDGPANFDESRWNRASSSRFTLFIAIHMPCGFLVATTDVAYVALVSYLAVEVAHDHAD